MRESLAVRRRDTLDRGHGSEPVVVRPESFRQAPASPVPATRVSGGLEVTLTNVCKAFGERQVLETLDIAVPAGQFLAVVGRSGGGKTTLMRLIAGLDRPNRGRVAIAGRTVDGLQRDVRLLFQDARLLPWQRVLGNVGIARAPGWREAAEAALADVGLADRAHDWPAVLSGGQRQRVALARALVSHPGVLLLDEPFGGLDALTRIEMHRLLARIWEEHRFTTILITHDVAEAVALADRVVVLREGRIAFDVAVTLARPRREAADPAAAAIQARILDEV
jgi:sulfonate transport system ATP-binding protein